MIPGITASTRRGAPEPPLPSEIGEPFGGGFYIGNVTITDGGQDDGQYCIIMAPSGSESVLPWQDNFVDIPGTVSLTNGLANSLSAHNSKMNPTPAASYCINYRGGYFDDWYLPALEELMLVWTNRSQLTVLGATGAHWSSTQGYTSTSYNLAWWVTVHTGASGAAQKAGNYRARPVRRIKMPDL